MMNTIMRGLGLVLAIGVTAITFLSLIGFVTTEDIIAAKRAAAQFLYSDWGRYGIPVVITVLAAVCAVIVMARSDRRSVRRSRSYINFDMKLDLIILVAFIAAGCATTARDDRPRIIYEPYRETPAAAPQLPPKQPGAANPCGIPEPIVKFVSAGYKGVFNQNMPPEVRFIVNDWARCAGGRVVNTSRAVLQFEWDSRVETVHVSAFGAYDTSTVGGYIANRVAGAFGAVLNNITVNGSSVGSSSVNYVQRVTLWFFLTGTNQDGVQELSFNGRGVDFYLDGAVCQRQCGFEKAAVRALRNMH